MNFEGPPEDLDDWMNWVCDQADHQSKSVTLTRLLYDQMFQHISQARSKVPKSEANWESAAFFGPAVAATVALLSQGRLESYAQFRQLASALWGWEVRPFIPSLFAAGTMHPSLHRETAEKLAATLTLHDLRIIDT